MTEVLTIAVRGSDGGVFHREKTSEKKLKQLATRGGGTCQSTKWVHIVRQLLEHHRPCTVRLIVGWDRNGPIVEELTYRPK